MNDYRKQIFLEFAGASRYEIISTLKLPDGDRFIDVSDLQSKEPPTTYVQSKIPAIPNDEVRSFLLRQLKLIQSGVYDD
ncbi:hypothetical protein [Halobacillus campisalis]|uniref:Uncharacterized protein n=1 Tax=Halobacillus campisalis TaxID=435909 RepID=A0ABW2K720_9BACI|nr:hypothetical protein [Halobacillus campisalis]